MIEIIPAIDIIDGKCVRLTQGDYSSSKTYYDDPLEAALMYKEAGAKRLHMVDLDGAKASSPVNLDVLERIVSRTGLKVQYGGGIKNADAMKAVLSHGADRVICGSVAVTHPEFLRFWLREEGGERIVLGADTRDGYVATHGWLYASQVAADELIGDYILDGLQHVICTEISHDGTLLGPAFDLYKTLTSLFPTLDITASGGVGSMKHIARLEKMGVPSVVVGKAIYEGKITIEELSACWQKE